MQTQGSLAQTSLASLLESMQSERATGTLTIASGSANCALYFLFGHLFHASGDLGQGEEAVIGALNWQDGTFQFDPRAKLPAEETIKTGTGELLAEAERRGNGVHASNGSTPTDSGPAAEVMGEAVSGSPATASLDDDVIGLDDEPAPTRVATMAPPASTSPSPIFGNLSAPPMTEIYPLPAGRAVYEGLKSAFVDFPKLLRTLEGDKLTGYVRLDGSDFEGVLLFLEGRLLEALYGAGSVVSGEEAFHQFHVRMDRGDGLLDVIELSPETLVALSQLLTARPLYTGLLGRFINFDALLEHLAEENINGSLAVTGGSETGVILLRQGNIHGAYTQSHRQLQDTPNAVSSLAAEREARIEVKSGEGAPAGIDVQAALRRPV